MVCDIHNENAKARQDATCDWAARVPNRPPISVPPDDSSIMFLAYLYRVRAVESYNVPIYFRVRVDTNVLNDYKHQVPSRQSGTN